jgi:hypothetical protein
LLLELLGVALSVDPPRAVCPISKNVESQTTTVVVALKTISNLRIEFTYFPLTVWPSNYPSCSDGALA